MIITDYIKFLNENNSTFEFLKKKFQIGKSNQLNKELIELIENNMGEHSLNLIAIKKISDLIKSGANVNVKTKLGFTPLMYASRSHNINFVKELLNAGADVNPEKDVSGGSPIMWACSTGDLKIVLILLEFGAELYCKAKVKNQFNKAVYSLDYLASDKIQTIKNKFPKQYKDYIKKKEFEEALDRYNL